MRRSLHEGSCSFERGRKLFDDHCAKCHRFEGRGHDVGPALDGAARDIEYLLINVLDPNRVVGQPYFTRVVALKNGRVESGLFAGEDPSSVTLKGENGVLKVFDKKDIDTVTEHAKSLMPEGLDKNMTVQDFRDVVRYVMANPFITRFAVAGPLPADKAPLPADCSPIASPELGWHKVTIGPAGRIVLPDSGAAGEKIALLAAKVFAPEETTSRLVIGGVHPIQVWINKCKVYASQPSKGVAEPDQAGVDVRLLKGENSVVFQVNYQGKHEVLFARFLDPHRQLRYEEGER
jgi:putative heme-binding domain-containing protein